MISLVKRRTLIGYAATRVLDTPFWAIFNLIPFILYKDLGASPFQIAMMVMLKPLVSLLSLYWSHFVKERPDRLLSNIVWARILGYLPFLLVPFIENPWLLIAAQAFYMMLSVGIVPAWMEILKLNLPKEMREKTFVYTQAFGYMGGGLMPFLLGFFLDSSFQAWRWVFPVTAVIGISAMLFQLRILIDSKKIHDDKSFNVVDTIKAPWTNALTLLKERKDFRLYQIGFMFVGASFMIIQPALPVFFVDVLNLSYTELSVAVTLCKGIGFALASPFWARMMSQLDIFYSSSLVALLASLFPFALIMAESHLMWLWAGYIIYGIAQAGSELNWNMSGPIFSRDKDSSLFSSINVVATGFRGTFVPAIGSLTLMLASSVWTMGISGGLALIGAAALARFRKQATELAASSHDVIPLG